MNLKKKFVMVLACLLLAFSCMGLVACGHPDSCTINFVYPDGFGTNYSIVVDYGTTIPADKRPVDPQYLSILETEDNQQYTFAGWGTGKDISVPDSSNFFDFNYSKVYKDITLYTKYVLNK